jgi:4-amino-4-deoxy-L-arabinose transferase-like glycosyltransferase
MPRLLRDYVIVSTAAVVVFFVNLGGPRLWDRDEPRNAGCAREMLIAGDWVTPVFNAELRTHKPVLLYWFMMTAYSVGGANEFTARFWSAALAVGTVLITYHLGRRLFHARVGVWAGVALASALMFDVAARAATPDSVLIFFSALSLLVYVLATHQPPAEDGAPNDAIPAPLSWPAAVLMYGLMGVAMLAKGPVGLVLPTAVVGMYLLIVTLPHKDAPWWLQLVRPFAPLHFLRTCWRMRPITALAASFAVALPWYVWVHVRTGGEWTEGFFFTHNLSRATAPMEGHDGSVLFYPLAVMVGFFPWSVFTVPLLIDLTARLRRGDPCRPGYVFAACWVGVYLGLFSLAQTKLPSYVTPMYPALALLAGSFIYHWTRGAALVSHVWPRASFAVFGAVGLTALVAIPLAARQFAPGEEFLGVLGLVPLAAAVACFLLMQRGNHLAAAQVFAVSAVALMAAAFGYGAARADRHQQSHQLLEAIAARSEHPHIGAFGCLEPSWVFYSGHPVRELEPEQLTDQERGFFSRGSDAFVITTRERLEEVQDALPDTVRVLAEVPYFMRNQQLVLLGHANALADERMQTPLR